MLWDKIPDRYFEIAGTIVGISAAAFTVLQIYTELTNNRPSTLSVSYVIGFLLIFAFWTLYGIRFRRIAIWLTNAMALLLQIVLLTIILK
jgi:uncharacterized protein with PQ loop repeat